MTLRYQGADPDQWPDESPNGSRLPVSTVCAAGRPTPGPCGMGLTPVLGSSTTDRLLAVALAPGGAR